MERICESSVVCRGKGKRAWFAQLACLLVHTVGLCSLILAPEISSAPAAPCPFPSLIEGQAGTKLRMARDSWQHYRVIICPKATPTRTPHGIKATAPHSACNLRTLTKTKNCENFHPQMPHAKTTTTPGNLMRARATNMSQPLHDNQIAKNPGPLQIRALAL